jgi:uncharacterized protein (TIGR02001 family)
MKKLFATAGVATLVASFPSVGAAQGAAATPEHTLTGNLSLVSEYRYRGISQTDFKPAVQGGFDYAHKSGFYLGTWASNVSWLSDSGFANNSLEWDFYGGFKGSAGDFGYDVGALYYWYPGNYDNWTSLGNPKPNTTEIYVAGTWKMLTAKYSYAISDIFGFPDSKGSSYFDLTGNFDIGQGFTLVAHYGYQNFETSLAGDWSYSDWKIGIGKEFVGLNWGLNYIDTNADSALYSNYRGKNLGKSTVQLTVSKTF